MYDKINNIWATLRKYHCEDYKFKLNYYIIQYLTAKKNKFLNKHYYNLL